MENDICSSKHGDNAQSVAANKKNLSHRTRQRWQVLELIKDSPDGLSMKEVASIMNTQFNAISGRGTELRKFGLVEPTGETREGSAVLRATSRVFQPIVVTRVQPQDKPAPDPVKPLSPSQARKEREELNYMYEHTEISSETYDASVDRIFEALDCWAGVK